MSTRANIEICDSDTSLFFYRHSDGYPKVALKTLKAFMRGVESGIMRSNAVQSAGWLIVIGRDEYAQYPSEWKVGAYEPTDSIHGDAEFFYELDLVKMEIRVFRINRHCKHVLIQTCTDFREVEE